MLFESVECVSLRAPFHGNWKLIKMIVRNALCGIPFDVLNSGKINLVERHEQSRTFPCNKRKCAA